MFVNATDLDLWSETRESEGQLPALVRRLIYGAAGQIDEIEFRAGDGVTLSGWDGKVSVNPGSSHVPAGTSRWELSTSGDLPAKPTSDYTKRTSDPLGADPSTSTFVYATTRRWDGKSKWAEARRERGEWADVRAYDADDLETWLEQTPTVHIWLSRLLGKHPPDALDMETFWDEWSGATNPRLSSPLVLAGRQEEARRLIDWLTGQPELLSLRAETEAEAIAFLAATLDTLPDEDRERFFARSAILASEGSWRTVSYALAPAILVPRFADKDAVPTAVGRGHHVLIPTARNQPVDRTTLELPMVDREAAKAALADMGLGDAGQDEGAKLAWRGLMILRRHLAVSPALMTPGWAVLPNCRKLLPAVLSGSWDESRNADTETLSELAQVPYPELRDHLLAAEAEPDAAVKRVGSTWYTIARADSWSLLSRYLTEPELSRFQDQALKIMREQDPKFELPASDRHAAAVFGKTLEHSSAIRDGVAETIGLLGAYGGIEGAMSGEQLANWIVRETLADADWVLWASLTHQLPMLAEASPSDFMDAVERSLDASPDVIAELFRNEVDLFTSSPSVGLLWALETLAWKQDHLPRATKLLAAIDESIGGDS